jgi:hypothetical protein
MRELADFSSELKSHLNDPSNGPSPRWNIDRPFTKLYSHHLLNFGPEILFICDRHSDNAALPRLLIQ